MTAPAAISKSDGKRVRASDVNHGIVYFLGNLSQSTVKVGYTTNLRKRVDVLQTGNHARLEVCGFIKAHRTIEKIIHGALAPFAIRNEWFDHDACVDDLFRKIEDFEIEHGLKTGDYSPIISMEDISVILNRWRSAWPGCGNNVDERR